MGTLILRLFLALLTVKARARENAALAPMPDESAFVARVKRAFAGRCIRVTMRARHRARKFRCLILAMGCLQA